MHVACNSFASGKSRAHWGQPYKKVDARHRPGSSKAPMHLDEDGTGSQLEESSDEGYGRLTMMAQQSDDEHAISGDDNPEIMARDFQNEVRVLLVV